MLCKSSKDLHLLVDPNFNSGILLLFAAPLWRISLHWGHALIRQLSFTLLLKGINVAQ